MRNNIKELRTAAGMKQSQLAEKAGISQENVSRYESGKLSVENMTLKMAAAISKALGCTIEDLFKGPENAERTVYIVRRYSTTIKGSDFEYSEGCTVDYDMNKGLTDISAAELMRTESLKEALMELANHRSFARKNSFSNEWDITEYWVDSERWDFEDEEDPTFVEIIGAEKYADVDIID